MARWNFGLEEDLDRSEDPPGTAGARRLWNHPHLPWISVFGMQELWQLLDDEVVMLDVPGTDFDEFTEHVSQRLLAADLIPEEAAADFKRVLMLHSKMHTVPRPAPLKSTKRSNSSMNVVAGRLTDPAAPSPSREARDSDSRISPSSVSPPQLDESDEPSSPPSSSPPRHDPDNERDDDEQVGYEDYEEYELLCPDELEEAVDILVGEVRTQ